MYLAYMTRKQVAQVKREARRLAEKDELAEAILLSLSDKFGIPTDSCGLQDIALDAVRDYRIQLEKDNSRVSR
jgi:hypothetical protein